MVAPVELRLVILFTVSSEVPADFLRQALHEHRRRPGSPHRNFFSQASRLPRHEGETWDAVVVELGEGWSPSNAIAQDKFRVSFQKSTRSLNAVISRGNMPSNELTAILLVHW